MKLPPLCSRDAASQNTHIRMAHHACGTWSTCPVVRTTLAGPASCSGAREVQVAQMPRARRLQRHLRACAVSEWSGGSVGMYCACPRFFAVTGWSNNGVHTCSHCCCLDEQHGCFRDAHGKKSAEV